MLRYTLKEYTGESKDIDIIDPYYSNEKYQEVLKTIDNHVKKAIEKIKAEKKI